MNIEVLLILLAILVGMALLASQHLPEFTDAILSLVISSTIIFELIGPMMARKALILEKINGTGNPCRDVQHEQRPPLIMKEFGQKGTA